MKKVRITVMRRAAYPDLMARYEDPIEHAHGGGDFCDGWMKKPRSAMISCNDGFRPVRFSLEALDEDPGSGENGGGANVPDGESALPGEIRL